MYIFYLLHNQLTLHCPLLDKNSVNGWFFCYNFIIFNFKKTWVLNGLKCFPLVSIFPPKFYNIKETVL